MQRRKKREQTTKSTIQKKLLRNSISVIAISLLIVGGVSSYMNYSSTVQSLEQTMVETVKQSANTITNKMEGYKILSHELSYNPVLTSDDATDEEILAECAVLAERNGLNVVAVTDAEGVNLTNNQSMAEFLFFSQPKQTGETFVSNLVPDIANNTMNIYVSSPVMKNGKFDGIVYFGMDATVLCEIAESIKIGNTGNASIINGSGDTIGYSDRQLVLDAYNTQNEVAGDPQLKQLAEIERRVMNGETGFGSYAYGGVNKYAAYAPIQGTPGWGMYVAVEKDEFLNSTYIGLIIVIVLLFAALAIGIYLMIRSAKGIVMPIKNCVNRITLLAEGDIHSEVPQITTGDETQVLAESMGSLVYHMMGVIGDIDYCLKELADGNFTVRSQAEENYVGDFASILKSMRRLKEKLSSTMIQIMESSEQVSLGADHLSQNAQSLADGATEQAGAVQELTATIVDVANLSQASAQAAETACRNVEAATREAEASSADMESLRGAMERISDTSKDIENIIAEIEDIASQTNLLSLNASIEAARAGEAGKGFAVVAEQIGKLAADSAQSAVNTKELIGKSLEEISRGNEITMKTTAAFGEIIEKMRDFGQMANEVSDTSANQASVLKEIEQGVEQISSVVQSNSASAEETSATSEELSAQSTTLNELVSKFRCE